MKYEIKIADDLRSKTACYKLRYLVLRKPWNQPEGSECDSQENEAFTAGAFNEAGEALGTGRVQFNETGQAQIRYMAVANEVQGQGIGKLVLAFLEQLAKDKGAKGVVLNARENAIDFYLNNGYMITGEAPTIFGVIRHVRMEKLF